MIDMPDYIKRSTALHIKSRTVFTGIVELMQLLYWNKKTHHEEGTMNLLTRAIDITQDCNQYGVRLVQSIESRKLKLVEISPGDYGCSESVYKALQRRIVAFNKRVDNITWQDSWS
jgi:hypothetical protein